MRNGMKIVGLMSGTSADGVDAALIEISGKFPDNRIEIIKFKSFEYPEEVRKEIFSIFAAFNKENIYSLKILPVMNFLLGEIFADFALKIISEAGISPSDVDAIASHGQTVYHRGRKCTLQIGDGSVIAYRTGIDTVSDFRIADIAAGGEGAPLVPMADYILFRHKSISRAVLNIGGIANLTCIPASASCSDLTAFDTGPGNMIVDSLINHFSDGKEKYDRDGKRAARGKIIEEVLSRWLLHPYFDRLPPKSTGREEFGEVFVEDIIRNNDYPPDDLIATASAFTTDSIASQLMRFFPAVEELIIGGGGSHNKFMTERLKKNLPRVNVKFTSDFGIPVDAREAVSFAILGFLTLSKIAGNIPSATGARRSVILGKISRVKS